MHNHFHSLQISSYMHSDRISKPLTANPFYPVQVGGGGIVRDPLVHKEVI